MFRGFISLKIIGLFGSILSITSLYRCLWCFNTARSAISTFDVIGILRRFSSLTDTDPSSAVCHSFHFLVALLCVFVWGLQLSSSYSVLVVVSMLHYVSPSLIISSYPFSSPQQCTITSIRSSIGGSVRRSTVKHHSIIHIAHSDAPPPTLPIHRRVASSRTTKIRAGILL